MPKVLVVSPVPARKGYWLGVQDGSVWWTLAKFRSDAAKDEFLAVLRSSYGLNVVEE